MHKQSAMILRSATAMLWIAVAGIVFAGCARKAVIHEAVMNDDLEKVRALLRSDPHLICARDDRDQTPLYYASNKEMADLLLANKADVNATNNGGRTPLLVAALHGRGDVVELLVANGANVKTTGRYCGSP